MPDMPDSQRFEYPEIIANKGFDMSELGGLVGFDRIINLTDIF